MTSFPKANAARSMAKPRTKLQWAGEEIPELVEALRLAATIAQRTDHTLSAALFRDLLSRMEPHT